MRVFRRSIFLSTTLVAFSSFAGITPWMGGPIYNPMGNPGGFLTAPANSGYNTVYNQQGLRSGLSQEARNVIARWTLKVDNSRETPKKITDGTPQINADRRVLDDALKTPGVTMDELNSIGQIKVLLNLAEVRQLTNQAATAQTSFPATYRNLIGEQKSQRYPDRGGQSRTEDWYTAKRDRLRVLLNDLQEFLNRSPQFAQNPPDLLIGLLPSLQAGSQALDLYNKFCNCFTNANLSYCKTLAQAAPSKGGRGFSSGFSDDDSDNRDDRFDDNQGFDPF